MRKSKDLRRLIASPGASLLVLIAALSGCSRDSAPGDDDRLAPAAKAESIVFPPALRAADDSVNVMLLSAMEACLTGDYESFRLLWSAKVEPVDRERFVNHFQSVKKIAVRALEKDRSADREAYALYAEVTFDGEQLPEHHELRTNPVRRVILLVIREQDAWRLSSAPKPVRAWLAKKVEGEGAAEKPELFEGGSPTAQGS